MQKLNFETTEAKAIKAEALLFELMELLWIKSADCYEGKIVIHRKREAEGGSAATCSVWQGPAHDQHDVHTAQPLSSSLCKFSWRTAPLCLVWC